MKALITGIAGFAASHLADTLLEEGIEVFGIEIKGARLDNLEHIKCRIKVFSCDVSDVSCLKRVLRKVKPSIIFHLAAQSVPHESWFNPANSLKVNIIGTANILEAVKELRLNARIHISSSAECYGFVHSSEVPITESQLFRPLSPYGVGKAGQDLLGYQYFKSYGMQIVRTRAFNHFGPRMSQKFAPSSFARQIALIEKDKQEPVIYVGDLKPIRDFTDVRDIASAYWLSLKKGESGEVYNVCSGKGNKISNILETLLRFSDKMIDIKVDKKRFRPSDVKILVGDNSKFSKATGWKPKVSFDESLRDLLDYWRERV